MMKKVTIITIMAMFTIMAVAQTSRRENNVSSTTKQETKVTRTQTSNNNNKTSVNRTSRPDTRQSTTSRNYENKKPASSLPSPHYNGNTNSKPANSKNATPTTRTRNYSSSNDHNRNHTSYHNHDSYNRRATDNTHVTIRKNTTHSDVVYSTPRKNYRVHSYNPGYHSHYHHADYYAKPYYRAPRRVNTYWSIDMYHDYRVMYPFVKVWHIPYGTRIETIPAYDADFHVGEVNRVYGKVKDVYYSTETDEYFLYFGNEFPYQQFTVILPGHLARRYSSRPARFFDHEYVTVTGYITEFDGRPEMLVSKKYQIDIY